jgi:S1-C subfamily serine protease
MRITQVLLNHVWARPLFRLTLATVFLYAPAASGQIQGGPKTIPAGGERTLVIPPAPLSSPQTPSAPFSSTRAPAPDIGSDNAPLPGDVAPAPEDGRPLPYIGMSVIYTVAIRDGQQVSGLEVTEVDPNSPAERAGLKIPAPRSTLGATGETTGELLGPLDAALKPLLVKTGQLGEDGDLIVAIDDHRVTSDSDLPDRLARLHPGDIIYLTVLRQQRGGAYKSVKVPVTLGLPKEARASR